jgi:hypothetical protein
MHYCNLLIIQSLPHIFYFFLESINVRLGAYLPYVALY